MAVDSIRFAVHDDCGNTHLGKLHAHSEADPVRPQAFLLTQQRYDSAVLEQGCTDVQPQSTMVANRYGHLTHP